MMQGDAYGIPIEITKEDGTVVSSSDVSEVEITIGPYTKNMTSGAVIFEDGLFIFPVSESESFKIMPKPVKAQVRVMWKNGEIEGVRLGEIQLLESMSKEGLST